MGEDYSRERAACGSDCGGKTEERTDFREKPHELSHIGKVIGVISGKGGVGKSLVTSLLAVSINQKGLKTAILDADITGPSIPKIFGLHEEAGGSELGLYPVESRTGISVMSLNLILQNDTDPVVWRGPIIAGTVRQFWTDVIWGDVDFMFIDMPPGTGDVPLTVFQSIPVDGLIVVTSPQELVSMIVGKAVNMARIMEIPVLGLVENMSYFKCPGCGGEYRIFGESQIDAIAEKFAIKTVSRLPVDPGLTSACDTGTIELFHQEWLDNMVQMLLSDGKQG